MSELHWAAVFCVVVAAVLAWRKTQGWGWFLFIGFFVFVSIPTHVTAHQKMAKPQAITTD
jgi:hypothetical protein